MTLRRMAAHGTTYIAKKATKIKVRIREVWHLRWENPEFPCEGYAVLDERGRSTVNVLPFFSRLVTWIDP